MEVAMVEAVLKSSMGRMRRRSRRCMKQERERLEMWLEKERRGSKVTPRLRTGASEVKEVEDELSERCIEGSGILDRVENGIMQSGRFVMICMLYPSYEFTQISPLPSPHSSFTPNSKHCSSTNPILIYRLPRTSLPVSTPNTIHHSCLTVCLSDSLDLDRCLSILFRLSACEKAGSCNFAFVGALEIRSLRLRLHVTATCEKIVK